MMVFIGPEPDVTAGSLVMLHRFERLSVGIVITCVEKPGIRRDGIYRIFDATNGYEVDLLGRAIVKVAVR